MSAPLILARNALITAQTRMTLSEKAMPILGSASVGSLLSGGSLTFTIGSLGGFLAAVGLHDYYYCQTRKLENKIKMSEAVQGIEYSLIPKNKEDRKSTR